MNPNAELVSSDVTKIMLKQCQDLETTLDSISWVPDWTMPLEEVVFLGNPLKGPHSNPRELFVRFFANAKRSESTGITGPEIFKKRIGDISRHCRGKEEVFPLNERVRAFRVHQGSILHLPLRSLFRSSRRS